MCIRDRYICCDLKLNKSIRRREDGNIILDKILIDTGGGAMEAMEDVYKRKIFTTPLQEYIVTIKKFDKEHTEEDVYKRQRGKMAKSRRRETF